MCDELKLRISFVFIFQIDFWFFIWMDLIRVVSCWKSRFVIFLIDIIHHQWFICGTKNISIFNDRCSHYWEEVCIFGRFDADDSFDVEESSKITILFDHESQYQWQLPSIDDEGSITLIQSYSGAAKEKHGELGSKDYVSDMTRSDETNVICMHSGKGQTRYFVRHGSPRMTKPFGNILLEALFPNHKIVDLGSPNLFRVCQWYAFRASILSDDISFPFEHAVVDEKLRPLLRTVIWI